MDDLPRACPSTQTEGQAESTIRIPRKVVLGSAPQQRPCERDIVSRVDVKLVDLEPCAVVYPSITVRISLT